MNLEAARRGGVWGATNPTLVRLAGTLITHVVHGKVAKIARNVVANSSCWGSVGWIGNDSDHKCKYAHKQGPHTGVWIEFFNGID